MKNYFKRNRKPEPTPDQGPKIGLDMNVLALPKSAIEKGVYLYVTPDGAQVMKHPYTVFKELNTKLSIEFDPYVCYDGRQYWEVTFVPEYYYQGRSYGLNGTKAVKEIGVTFPNGATPDAENVSVKDDGRITWRASYYPEPEKIAAVVNEANRQVAEILRDFGRAEAIMKVVKGSKWRSLKT